MHFFQANILRKLGILILLILMALTVASCKSDDPVTPLPPIENRAPGVPLIDAGSGGPADGATAVSLAAALHWNCTDPDGDVLAFTVHFGTAAAPAVVSTDQAGSSFDPTSLDFETTYYWQIMAKDPDGETATSPVWNFTTGAQAVETVSQPDVPTGPATGLTGENLEFTASGATSSFGFPVEYRFDWGGGDLSAWSAATTVAHSWSAEGSYDVITQARSSHNNTVESDWSAATTVEISAALETITMLIDIDGPYVLGAGEVGDYTIGGNAYSSEGHTVELRFVWGDGTFSDWSTLKAGSHIWDTAGTFDIDVQARCSIHTSVTAERLVLQTIEVAASETVAPPSAVRNMDRYSSLEYWVTSNSSSSFGHPVEIQYDFGDGVISDWVLSGVRTPHAWALGTYDIVAQARCVEHPDIVSEWGTVVTMTFVEIVWEPTKPTGPLDGVVGVPVTYSTTETTSNEGHAIEYRFYYRKIRETERHYGEWSTSTEGTLTYLAAGTKYVHVEARCIEHPDVLTSNTREYLTVVISSAP